jgi:hypothetical protein
VGVGALVRFSTRVILNVGVGMGMGKCE